MYTALCGYGNRHTVSSLERCAIQSILYREVPVYSVHCCRMPVVGGSVEHTVISFRLAVYVHGCMPNSCCELLSGGAAVV